MDTLIAIEVPAHAVRRDTEEHISRALGWFAEVEERCSRFAPESELRQLCRNVGRPVAVSPLLFQVLEFALAVAERSRGAFDPTVGGALERAGFVTNYRTRASYDPSDELSPGASYREVTLDRASLSVRLRSPLILDLGGVAKGFAVDLAAEELAEEGSFAIYAGGDVRVGGLNGEHAPWRIGIRHPREAGHLADLLALTSGAICTSGDDERRAADGGHHILVPTTGRSAQDVVSVTVVAPTAIVADALATAAFVLGPRAGLELLEAEGVEGLLITREPRALATRGFAGYHA